MTNLQRSYRSSQLISPFGPGSIIDIGDESLILMDISHWPRNLEEIKLDRLTKEAGVWSLKKPPVVKQRWGHVHKENSLTTYRFPRWMFCPKCRYLKQWKREDTTNENGIPICGNSACTKRTLVPMRFVAACNKGHLQDVPWDLWAHMKQGKKCSAPKEHLYFQTVKNQGSGLGSLKVTCRNPGCGASNSLADIMNEKALPIPCSDRQPWEFKEGHERSCDEPLHVLQRGASNLYFPVIRSALDIPITVSSTGNPIINIIGETDDYFDLKRALENGKEKVARSYAEELAEEFDFSVEEIINAVSNNGEASREFKIPKDEDLRLAEWEILSKGDPRSLQTTTFKARKAKWEGEKTFGCENLIKQVVLLDKLREVRAFCGFERISPSDDIIPMKDTRTKYSWLPACEVYGEGIFIEFNANALNEWENLESSFITPRLHEVERRCGEMKSTFLPFPSPKFIMLHTFAHLLIRQLSFESGYSSGSIRERIYSSEGQAGILIYTADGDSEGSLGGLVQQGEANRLFPAIIAALETANWCSNDPVCSELDSQGVMGLNKAACHSCTLISETSCEHNNLLLDRKLLIGENGEHGLFSSIMNQVSEGHY
ncbi:DUF1998 domain-containing protein [Psychrosphaera aestuarii]|uniref:DUF1998 domain-containing protein n=1 Tax=Psychrosphaera aestuarii TaxID=1266052 RepID=UPI001B33A619|nr:DUF1998 domain-containing protein [Psychrosphaera aestuarii]